MSNVELSAGMHCRSCEQRVQRAVGTLDGVSSVETDLKRERVAIQFDDQLLDESEVRAAVARALTDDVLGE